MIFHRGGHFRVIFLHRRRGVVIWSWARGRKEGKRKRKTLLLKKATTPETCGQLCVGETSRLTSRGKKERTVTGKGKGDNSVSYKLDVQGQQRRKKSVTNPEIGPRKRALAIAWKKKGKRIPGKGKRGPSPPRRRT